MTNVSSLTVPDSVSFPEAIALTQSFLEQMATGALSETEIAQVTENLVRTENGARGFFVTYLSDEGTLPDRPSPGIFQGLGSSEEIVSELMVKNLAMSSAMVIAHRRSGDETTAQGSERVRDRSTVIIQTLALPTMHRKIESLLETIRSGTGSYQSFLERWKYDAEQKAAIATALQAVL
ncbi:hypothetical protein [Laspinema olomoucense]|uniref:hypothetical protein n=1 Tax=Laspinema olomoucense TaxID=3231600 RepID=UPI0021BA9A09|nr:MULTISPECIES: hypothetical protein [unclassified Laspinema]MCT7990391.1 hypothetical protein [Laspinema sp. D3a]MCT7994857.1 hypothetical protein [Laspinema sp. D3c]